MNKEIQQQFDEWIEKECPLDNTSLDSKEFSVIRRNGLYDGGLKMLELIQQHPRRITPEEITKIESDAMKYVLTIWGITCFDKHSISTLKNIDLLDIMEQYSTRVKYMLQSATPIDGSKELKYITDEDAVAYFVEFSGGGSGKGAKITRGADHICIENRIYVARIYYIQKDKMLDYRKADFLRSLGYNIPNKYI